jgi:hypothetical protein
MREERIGCPIFPPGSAYPNSSFLWRALGFVKDVAVAVIDKVVVSYIDAWVSLVKNIYSIASECSGLMLASVATIVVIFSALAFLVPILAGFAIVYGFIFSYLMTQVLDKIVESGLGLCKSLD